MSDNPEGNAVEPHEGDELREQTHAQGEQVAAPATGVHFNPDAPVATSAPPPEWQSGKPELGDEQVQARPHAEQSITDPGTPDEGETDPNEGDVGVRKEEQKQAQG